MAALKCSNIGTSTTILFPPFSLQYGFRIHSIPNIKIPNLHLPPTTLRQIHRLPRIIPTNRRSTDNPLPRPNHPLPIRQPITTLLHLENGRHPSTEYLHQIPRQGRYHALRTRRVLSRMQHLLPPHPAWPGILCLYDRRAEPGES